MKNKFHISDICTCTLVSNFTLIPWRHFWIAHASFWHGNLLLPDIARWDIVYGSVPVKSWKLHSQLNVPPCWPGSNRSDWAPPPLISFQYYSTLKIIPSVKDGAFQVIATAFHILRAPDQHEILSPSCSVTTTCKPDTRQLFTSLYMFTKC